MSFAASVWSRGLPMPLRVRTPLRNSWAGVLEGASALLHALIHRSEQKGCSGVRCPPPRRLPELAVRVYDTQDTKPNE
jgi:hypothetical protein